MPNVTVPQSLPYRQRSTAPCESLTDALPSQNSSSSTPTKNISFLALPGEIRNTIYRFAWILSREKSLAYNLPDLEIHPSKIEPQNVKSFALLFTCKQVYREVLPVVSAVGWMEIRAYEQPWEDREPAGLRQLVLEKAKELCKYAEKVTLRVSSLTTKQWASYTVLGGLRLFLRSCERLRDLEIKVSLNGAMPAHCDVLEPLLELADNGLEIDIELIYTEEGLYVPLRDYERHIGRIARRAAGKQAQIWIEWTRVLSEDMKWTGFDWTLG